MRNDFFDKSVREKLAGHEAPVPPDAWANIQKGKRKRRLWPFFWVFAGLLLCGGAGSYFYKNGLENKMVVAEKKSSLQNDKTKIAAINNDQKNKMSDAPLASAMKARRITSLSSQKNNDIVSNDFIAIIAGIKKQKEQGKITQAWEPQNENTSIKNKNGNPITESGSGNSNNDPVKADDDKVSAKKRKQSADAPLAMLVTATQTMEENLFSAEDIKKDGINKTDSTPIAIKTANAKIAIEEKATGTTANTIAAKNKVLKPLHKKKTGLDIDLSLSAFMPLRSQVNISSVNRTLVMPLHKAVFTADKVSMRLQPSIGFNVLLYKSISAKTKLGAGLSYNVIKEYIHLSGQEVSTSYAVVKRLQSGNALVNDTVATVTKGTRNIDAVNSYTFLSIPVAIRYRVWQRKQWAMDLHAAIDFNLQSIYRNSIGGELIPQFSGVPNTKRNHTIGTGFNAAIRLSRSMGKNYLVYVAPSLQVNPTKLYLKEMLSPGKVHRAGLFFGISYGL